MNVLAIDTSHRRGSAAVRAGDRIESIRLPSDSSHLVELGKALSGLFLACGLGLDDIDRMAIVTGPGSFTGLRVGMAYLKGLHAARPRDVVVMTSLELLARGAAEEGKAVSPIIDARKDEVYAALYRPDGSSGLREIVAPCVVPPETHVAALPKDPTVFAGTGALRYRGIIEDAFGPAAFFADEGRCEPDAFLLCKLAEGLRPLQPGEVVVLEPFYVRPESATLKPLKGVSAYGRD